MNSSKRTSSESVPVQTSRASTPNRAVREAPSVGSRTSETKDHSSAGTSADARSVQLVPALTVVESATKCLPPSLRRRNASALPPPEVKVTSTPSVVSGDPAPLGDGSTQKPNVRPLSRPGSTPSMLVGNARSVVAFR